MKMYKAVFLDLDDTLWDCKANALKSFRQVFKAFNLSEYFETFENFYAIYSPYNEKMWQAYNLGQVDKETLNIKRFSYPFHQVGMKDARFIENFMLTYFDLVPRQSKLVDGAKDILDYLVVKYPLYILSNGFTEMQHVKMQSGGIEKYFKAVFLSDEIGVNKPDPRFFQYVLKSTGVDSSEVVMIGDNLETDIKGAASAGIDQVYFSPDSLHKADFKPTYAIDNLYALKTLL